ncbi:MAG: hypothetical protein AABY86_11275, partial [Bdellovibrionota bacterium]
VTANVCRVNLSANCELKKRAGSNVWYVQVDGSPMSVNYTQMNSAIEAMASFKVNRVCNDYTRQQCRVVKNSSNSLWWVTVGGENISGSSYTNLDSATTLLKSLLDKNLCEDMRFSSPCLLIKASGSNVWHLEQDGRHLSNAYTSMDSAKHLLAQLSVDKVCNQNLQPGCQLVKRPGANVWSITQQGESLSNFFTNIDSASRELDNLYSEGVCKRGECEIRQDRYGGVSVFRNGYSLNHADSLDSAISSLSDHLSNNTCDLPQNSKVCTIRPSHGRYYLLDNQKPLGGSENYADMLALRTRLQQLGYCTALSPNEIVADGYSSDAGEYNGPRSDIVLDFIEDSIVTPLPPTIPH